LDSREKDLKPSPLSSPIQDVGPSSGLTGRLFPVGARFVITAGFPCQDISVVGRREGLSGSKSSLVYALIGWLSRTRSTAGENGCPNCGANYGPLGMPLCAFECEPLKLAGVTTAPARSLLPTPTASSYGSCRGGGAGRVGPWRASLHSRGILDPEDWERMMGFPIGHTAAMPSGTRSTRRPRS
jgi:hypothetical protein